MTKLDIELTSSFIPPYRPFRGAQPPHFVERADSTDFGAPSVVAAALSAWAAGPASPRFHQLVISAPAVGKTALLRELCQRAESHLGWAAHLHRCLPKERALGTVASEVIATLARRWPGGATAISLGALEARVGGPERPLGAQASGPTLPLLNLVPLPSGTAIGADRPWAALRSALWRAGEHALSVGRGVLVAFDDAEFLSDGEAELLGHLARSLSRERLPVAFVLSGGEDLALRYARSAHFSGAIWPIELGHFDGAEAREALVVPAADRGVDFDGEALDLLCSASGGSPLQVQRLGFASWTAARKTRAISTQDAQQAVALVRPLAAAS
jgi:hypothetical protein